MALLGNLSPWGTAGSWAVKYGDDAAGTLEKESFLIDEYGTSAKAKKAARDWQKSKQPKWNKIISDRAKALEAKYNSLIKEMSAKGSKVPNKPYTQLNKLQQGLVKTTLWNKKKFGPEGRITYGDLVIGGETFRVPTSLLKKGGIDNYRNAIKLLQKWKKNPTVENLAALTLKADKGTGQVLRDFKKYLKGEELGYGAKKGQGGGQTTKLIKSFDLNKLLGKDTNLFKTAAIQTISAKQNLDQILRKQNPLTRGTNDFEPIIKTINKYKWNGDLTKLQNRGAILNSLKNNQVIIDRFKKKGEVLNNKNLIKRITGAHARILNDAFQDMQSTSLKNLSENQQQSYLKFAQNFFPQVNRAMGPTILENLKGADLKAAKTKLSHYGKLRTFLTKEIGATGGALSKGFLQFDHPLSLAALKKTGNIVGALNVNPIQGDLNIWKRELDLRLNALSKIDEKTGKLDPKNIKPLRALNNVNKVLFGKLGGDFTVTDEGIKIKSFGADPFLKANLIKGLKKNIGLKGELVKSFDLLSKEDPNIWDQIGIKDKNVFRQRLGETADINIDDFRAGILKWTKENPKWTKILEGRVGCRPEGASGGRVGLVAGGGPSACFFNKLKAVPELVVKAFRSLPKGGRIGAVVAGLGAVGAGAYAMMGDAEADETRTTDQSTMKYNSTTGTFDNTETGDPEDQTGILNWIAENPVKAGVGALPAWMGLGYGLSAAGMKQAGQHLMSWKAIIPAMMIPEKMHQWKTGMEAGEMATDPFNALWALGIRSKGEMAAVKAYYDTLPADARFSLKGLKSAKGWKDLPKAFRGALMSPAAKGTDLAFQKRLKPALKKLTESVIGSPFAKETAKKGLGALAKRAAIGLGAAALLPATVAAGLVSAPLTLGLGALSFGYAQYKDYRDGKAIVDAMRAKGKISEEDADKYMSLIKQGSLPFGLGNRLFGDDEMTIRGQALNPEQQRGLLAGMESQIDLFQEGRRDVRALDRADDFDFFSEGGRVGMKFGGGMDRRGFLKWLAALGATIAGGASGIFKTGAKKGIEQVVKQAPKKFIGVEGMPAWFPRAVQKIKTHGKLIEMADKHYVNGDIYEMILPTQVPKFDMVAGKQKMSGFKTVNKKVLLEENPVSGEIEISWNVDDFDGDMKRQINFRPGESGFQKFGADVDNPGAWEFQRVKVEEPEFTYGNPDQSLPERDSFDYKDIFEDGDEVVKALENLTGNKKMVAKDGSIIDTVDEKGIDEAFQNKMYKDIEGEGQILPDPEGHMTPDGWQGEKGNEIIGGEIPEKLYKKAEGGTVETGDIARRQSLVPPLAGPDPQGIMGLYSEPKQVRVG